jgi:hypothetical protein
MFGGAMVFLAFWFAEYEHGGVVCSWYRFLAREKLKEYLANYRE